MKSFEELERLWAAAAPLPRGRGRVAGITVRVEEGRHATPDRVSIDVARGVVGDRWSRGWRRKRDCQVTLMSARVAGWLAHDGVSPHAAGDNFLVELDLSEEALPVGTRLVLGTATVEVSPAPHTGCRKFSDRFGLDALRWVNAREHRPRRLRGINCRVIASGEVAVGDPIEVV